MTEKELLFSNTNVVNNIKKFLILNKGLSKTEADIYIEIIKGCSNEEVGENLYKSVKTVKFHVTRIYQKLKTSRTGLVWCIPLKYFLSQAMEYNFKSKNIMSDNTEKPVVLPKGGLIC